MKKLKALFEYLGYANVSTYINSGNVIFESGKSAEEIREESGIALEREFGFAIPTLVKSGYEMRAIADAIPAQWRNDSEQRTDVAYLFPEADSVATIDQLPVKREFIDLRYVSGAVYWNVHRSNYNKSNLNKIIGHRLYKFMTLRNVNTARFLAGAD